jgi:hypothetical protein
VAHCATVKSPELVVFCSEIETDLEAVRPQLNEVLERAQLEKATLQRISGPEGLKESGWMAVAITAPGMQSAAVAAALEPLLGDLLTAFAKALREKVLGICLAPDGKRARACLQPRAGYPRSTTGESFHVIRQAAAWLEADSNHFLRYFGAYAQSNDLIGPLDLSDVFGAGPAEGEAEVVRDADDQFVESRLKAAAEWMARYLGNRK